MKVLHRCLAGLLWSVLLAYPALGEIALLGEIVVPGDTLDRSGLTGTLENGVPVNRFGGVSAIDRLDGNRYVLQSDRGPDDGAVPYLTRFHLATIKIPDSGSEITFELNETHLLQKESGADLVGAAKVLHSEDDQPSRFDPEGMRVIHREQDAPLISLSDEYGPSVSLFDLQGIRQRELSIPERFTISHPSGKAALEAHNNQRGRQPNGGFEGLALSSDGHTLMAIMQRPLLQDAGLLKGRFHGRLNRILCIEMAHGTTTEWVYPLSSPETVVCEILCVDDQHALVLERDSHGGPSARFKRLELIDFSQASDVSKMETLPAAPEELATEVDMVIKTPWLDLLDPRYGIAGENAPSKIEGLSWGPDLPDGRRTLLIAIDNDFKADRPTRIFVFACQPEDLQ